MISVIHSGGSNNLSHVNDSFPELDLAFRRSFFGQLPISREILLGQDGEKYEVIVIDAPSDSISGDDLTLIYLKNKNGEFVDWKSYWSSRRLGNLEVTQRIAKRSGVGQISVIRYYAYNSDRTALSKLSAKNNRFIDLYSKESSKSRLFIQKMLSAQNYSVEAIPEEIEVKFGKVYEILIRITNRSNKSMDLTLFSPEIKGLYNISAWMSLTGKAQKAYAPGEYIEWKYQFTFLDGILPRKIFLSVRTQDANLGGD